MLMKYSSHDARLSSAMRRIVCQCYGRRPMSGSGSGSKYKDTVNLPDTKFPMRGDLATREPEILAHWDRTKLYDKIQTSRAGAPLWVLHEGPPPDDGRRRVSPRVPRLRDEVGRHPAQAVQAARRAR